MDQSLDMSNHKRSRIFLRVSDTHRLIRDILDNRLKNRQFIRSNPRFPVPPTSLAFDAYNHTNWNLYYERGIEHATFVSNIINEYMPLRTLRICEWGCGPARVIRHLRRFLDFDYVKLYGTDYNKRSIKWCRKNIKNISFRTNELQPPLSFDSGFFDCIYALSVFTHLPETMQQIWLKELFRTLTPEGIIIFTTHGNAYRSMLSPRERVLYDCGKPITRTGGRQGKKLFQTFSPPEHVRNNLLKHYKICRYIPSPSQTGLLKQDVWVVANFGDVSR